MQRYLQIACLMAALTATSAAAVADDSFLSQSLPTTWVCYSTPQELLQVLRSVVPRPLVLPAGMTLPDGMPARKPLINPTEAQKIQAGSGGLFGHVPADKKPFTVREYLDRTTRILGMTWSYDAARDAVVLDFPWHVASPQGGDVLVATLLKTTPLNDEKHIYSSTIDPKADAWRPAFNALLSKPGNYAMAWQVRWRMENVLPGITQPNNLFTGNLLDEAGTPHLLILNIQRGPGFTMGSVSTIGFYLFSETGKLEHAGIFNAEDGHGRRLQVEVDPSRKRLTLHNGIDPAYNRYDETFAVEKDRFVFKEGKSYGNPNAYYAPVKIQFEVSAD